MSELNINYGGHTLPENLTTHLISEGITHNVLPSLFIAQLYYESNWGNSRVARDNNNWGGLTWTGSSVRPSGIVVSRGTPRPSGEGGYYMKFDSVEDYLTDYVYLLTEQGIYNVSGHNTFEDTVRGLFRVGGASADYAAVGWRQYLSTMQSIRSGINNNNNNILNKIDSNPEDYASGGTGGSKPCFPTEESKVTESSPYGWRIHPIYGDLRFHSGQDWSSGGQNYDIYATQSGTVIVSTFSSTGGWMVDIKHSGDKYYSRYLHMRDKPLVNVGDKVSKCQKIGVIGTTGSSTGEHLHFEIGTSASGLGTENGTIDPLVYLNMTFGGGGTPPEDETNNIITLLLVDALNGWKY